jgi:hypothetical protein
MATKKNTGGIVRAPKTKKVVAPGSKQNPIVFHPLKDKPAKKVVAAKKPAPLTYEYYIRGGVELDGKKADLHRAITIFDVRHILLDYSSTAKVEFVKAGLIVVNSRGRKVAKIINTEK